MGRPGTPLLAAGYAGPLLVARVPVGPAGRRRSSRSAGPPHPRPASSRLPVSAPAS